MNLDNIKGLKDISIGGGRTQITFCRNCKTCPAIDISDDKDDVVLGGEEEGYTKFTKDQFAAFIDVVKAGAFDEYID